ncbi:MAG: glycosyltransferase [Prevotella sp.]|nr:glycosyltransferase [Prevotella sp.]
MIANQQPDISVILPTYKPEDYISKCIESLAGQTLSKERYELIIVLNGCREPYLTQINGVLKGYPALNACVVQTDYGNVSNARNIGLERARGRFIAFVDDDDWISANYLENLLNNAASDGIVQGNVCAIDDSTGREYPHYAAKAYQRLRNAKTLNVVNARSFLSAVWCKLIPREVLGTAKFDTACIRSQDSLFMFTISKWIKRINLAPADTVYFIRVRTGSASRKQRSWAWKWRMVRVLFVRYTRVWLSDIGGYSFLLYATRMLATFRQYFLR